MAELGHPAVDVRIGRVLNGIDSNLCQFVSRERLDRGAIRWSGIRIARFVIHYGNGEKCPARPDRTRTFAIAARVRRRAEPAMRLGPAPRANDDPTPVS